MEKAPAYFHWLADRARQKFDMRTVEGRMDGFKFLAPAIQRISDRLERFAVANDVADYLGVDEKLVRDHFSKGAVERPAPRRAEMPPTERLLLYALLASEPARAQVIPELSALPAVQRFVAKNVFQALFAMHSDGAPFRFSDLEGRLSDADRDLLSSVVFADEILEEEKAAEQATSVFAQPQIARSAIGSSPLCAPEIKAAETAGRSAGSRCARSSPLGTPVTNALTKLHSVTVKGRRVRARCCTLNEIRAKRTWCGAHRQAIAEIRALMLRGSLGLPERASLPRLDRVVK